MMLWLTSLLSNSSSLTESPRRLVVAPWLADEQPSGHTTVSLAEANHLDCKRKIVMKLNSQLDRLLPSFFRISRVSWWFIATAVLSENQATVEVGPRQEITETHLHHIRHVSSIIEESFSHNVHWIAQASDQ